MDQVQFRRALSEPGLDQVLLSGQRLDPVLVAVKVGRCAGKDLSSGFLSACDLELEALEGVSSAPYLLPEIQRWNAGLLGE